MLEKSIEGAHASLTQEFCNYYSYLGQNYNLCEGQLCYSYAQCLSDCCAGGYCNTGKTCNEVRGLEWGSYILIGVIIVLAMGCGVYRARLRRKQREEMIAAEQIALQQQ